MSKELNCMNCSIGDFKHDLCDCDNGFCKEFKSIGKQEDFFNAVMQRIRPQGEWIDAEIPLECGGSMPIQVCNLCKTFYPLAYTGGGHRFCPHCGARMKGADDETD